MFISQEYKSVLIENEHRVKIGLTQLKSFKTKIFHREEDSYRKKIYTKTLQFFKIIATTIET